MKIFARIAAVCLVVPVLAAWGPSPAPALTTDAAITSAFDDALTCATGADGVRTCSGIVDVPDAQALPIDPGTVPIDVNLFLPAAPAGSPDGPWPLIGEFHGWNGSKFGRTTANRFLDQGYAYFSMSDRGWGLSCGGSDPKRFDPRSGCRNGYNHLLDTRFEVRDAQYLMGLLADDGLILPTKIGVLGGSYGGGMSMALAALKDRVMPPDYEAGGTLLPWTSPNGTPMRIAAAAPDIPWTDLAYSLQPNGRTLDYVADAPYRGPQGTHPIGVMTQSFVSGLYGTGLAGSNYAPAGTDPDADLTTWYALISAGEPYNDNPAADDLIDELTSHHSSYYIDDSHEPAPLHISNGFTDDLFPADEAVRFYNKTLARWPEANLYLYFSDHGHQRGQNKAADAALRRASVDAWFAHFVKGVGSEPTNGVSVLTQKCGGPSEGPFSAPTWADLPQSEIVFKAAPGATLISPQAGNPASNQAYDPIAGGGACATASATDQPGLASYRLPPAPAGGYTLVGSPTVVADILNPSPNSQLAYRLLDVDPATGNGTLVARGLYRPDVNLNGVATRAVFQMHPNAYRFAEGRIAKLELLPHDAPYGRVSNGQGAITVSNLELRLPILEPAGTAGSAAPAPKVLPAGYTLAPDYVADPVDSDGDGIVDGQDDCPGEAGPGSTEPGQNGCPLAPVDTDTDGVPDASDACPTEPGPADNGGCPVLDSDQDGIADADDACPDDPGPASQDPDLNGCPTQEPPDADSDGIPDSSDACPDQAGPAATGGCPDADSDGVADAQDLCPSAAGPAADSGCPDTDGDGVHDGLDQCTDQQGPSANGGCPTSQPDPGGGPGPAADCSDNPVRGTKADDTITGTDEPEQIRGKRGDDRIKGRGDSDCLFGNRGEDRLHGGPGDDVVKGGRDHDALFGGPGDDRLAGGQGPDRILGGAGDDHIRADDGERDVIKCGDGVDTVVADADDKVRGCEKVVVRNA